MIQMQSDLIVADNSGAKKVQCIKILGGSGCYVGKVGDVCVVSIREVSSKSKVKKGTTSLALIIRSKKEILRYDGSSVKFDDNAVVLLNKNKEPIGTRVFGPVAREIRYKKGYMKIVSLAAEVL